MMLSNHTNGRKPVALIFQLCIMWLPTQPLQIQFYIFLFYKVSWDGKTLHSLIVKQTPHYSDLTRDITPNSCYTQRLLRPLQHTARWKTPWAWLHQLDSFHSHRSNFLFYFKLYSLVLLAIVCQDEVLESNLHLYPFLVREGRPYVMGLCDGCLVWFQDHLGPVVVHMECPEDENETGERLQQGKTYM